MDELVARIVLLITLGGAGALLMWSAGALATGRVGRNPLLGIRLRSTLASDEAWLAAHQRSRPHTFWAGALSLAAGVFAVLPLEMPVVLIAVLVAAVTMAVLVLRGAVLGSRVARAVTTSPASP